MKWCFVMRPCVVKWCLVMECVLVLSEGVVV